MKTIYKYPLELGYSYVEMPVDSKILSVANQRGGLCLWAAVDEISPYTGEEPILEERKFVTIGTGHAIPDGLNFIGTVIIEPFVWHVFEVLSEGGGI